MSARGDRLDVASSATRIIQVRSVWLTRRGIAKIADRLGDPVVQLSSPPRLVAEQRLDVNTRHAYKLYSSLDASLCFSITSTACRRTSWRHAARFFPMTRAHARQEKRRGKPRLSKSSKYTPEKFVSTGRPSSSHNVACKRVTGERGRQDLITFCRPAGWKLAQLHDADVVPCYHVNGRLNVLGRDKRVCGLAIYVATTMASSVPSIRPVKAGRILSLDVAE